MAALKPITVLVSASGAPGTVRSGATSTRPARSSGTPKVRASGEPATRNVAPLGAEEREGFDFAIVVGEQRHERGVRRLLGDPAVLVKIEYLQRELHLAATQRTEYSYPGKRVAPACPPAEPTRRMARVR